VKESFTTRTGRFTGEQSRHLNYVIAKLVNEGVRTGEIAKRLGVSYSTIADRIHQLRKNGVLSPFRADNPHQTVTLFLRKDGRRVGSVRSIFTAIGFDAARWVAENTPKGAMATDFIAAIIRDAYHESGEAEDGQ